MKCKDIMTKYIKMCRPECTVKDSTQIMKDQNCGAVPIVDDNNKVVGIVTDRDIAIKCILEEKDASRTKISEVMTKKVITCREDEDIDEAIRKMKDNKIRRIPIVDKNNVLLGMVSLGDIAVITSEEHEVYEALESISSPVSGAK